MSTQEQTSGIRGWMVVLLVLAILLIDQWLKIWVKTNMSLHESIEIFSWFKISFIENNGMAFGMEIGSKIFLSVFRMVAVAGLSYYIWLQLKEKARNGYVVLLTMILAGAIGNLIDCMFYGLGFEASTPFSVSHWVGLGNGYAPFLMGKVVDMFYFPLITTTWPEWVPMMGGQQFVFFSPIFNFADSSISVAVVLLLLFYRKEISEITLKKNKEEKPDEE